MEDERDRNRGQEEGGGGARGAACPRRDAAQAVPRGASARPAGAIAHRQARREQDGNFCNRTQPSGDEVVAEVEGGAALEHSGSEDADDQPDEEPRSPGFGGTAAHREDDLEVCAARAQRPVLDRVERNRDEPDQGANDEPGQVVGEHVHVSLSILTWLLANRRACSRLRTGLFAITILTNANMRVVWRSTAGDGDGVAGRTLWG